MRITIITGGGSGIGAAVARQLAQPGQALLLHGQGSDAAGRSRLERVAALCREKGSDVHWRAGDLSVEGEGKAIVETAQSTFGPIDAIVHAAGFADSRNIAALPRDGLVRSFAVMAAAFHELASAAMPDLTRNAQTQSRVVAVSSFVAHRFTPGATFPASAAAKAALEALVQCLAIELAPSGGTANAVAPGYTRKDAGRSGSLNAATWDAAAKANPLQRLAEADDVAQTIAFLLSPAASHVTGVILPVDGGLTLA